jgi:hypothetical protein
MVVVAEMAKEALVEAVRGAVTLAVVAMVRAVMVMVAEVVLVAGTQAWAVVRAALRDTRSG